MRPSAFAEWSAAGGFPDDSIFHQHAKFDRRSTDVIAAASAHLIMVVRDPYDTFVALSYWEQDRAARGDFKDHVRPRSSLGGNPLDHPDVFAFLVNDFGRINLAQANGWLQSGRATVIRYEDLHRDPVAALTMAEERIDPAPRSGSPAPSRPAVPRR